MAFNKLRNPKNTLFLLEAEVHDKLRRKAFETGLSMAEALREAVELWLRKKTLQQKGGRKMGP